MYPLAVSKKQYKNSWSNWVRDSNKSFFILDFFFYLKWINSVTQQFHHRLNDWSSLYIFQHIHYNILQNNVTVHHCLFVSVVLTQTTWEALPRYLFSLINVVCWLLPWPDVTSVFHFCLICVEGGLKDNHIIWILITETD